ncbi:hypothetical protein RhiirC2_800736 [Rhizophagus irregularis]|uniref:Uncharacterized protein n=1 Tax=Rhizophagus irregularis TaxID=588596 RepID=A0A2N1M387_9GLOM|nr:hypothetical protein RhiirC2_800736 [Rhizophagus irregularis]
MHHCSVRVISKCQLSWLSLENPLNLKVKLLTSLNGTSEEVINNATLVNNILKSQGFILYYQIADINQLADSPDRYYQLTISDKFWLKNACDYGKICIGIDGKYDFTKNIAGCGLLVAFDK